MDNYVRLCKVHVYKREVGRGREGEKSREQRTKAEWRRGKGGEERRNSKLIIIGVRSLHHYISSTKPHLHINTETEATIPS